MKQFYLFFLAVLFFSCKSNKTNVSNSDIKTAETKTESIKSKSIDKKISDLDLLQMQMAGHYSSEEQSKADKDYFNISLRMTPIWKDRGHYLFVEQALFDKMDKPYRVRVYKLSKNDKGQFISDIYTIKEEKNWIGKWANPKDYDALPLTDIEHKNGCEVILNKINDQEYKGRTGDKTCPSELRGASYASSIVDIFPTKIVSWDQGFDKSGKQVWGAEKGGYVFIKLKN